MSSPRFLGLFLATAVWCLPAVAPAFAQRSAEHTDHAESASELQQTFDAALATAKGSDSLDPAYELLGVAGTAQTRGLKSLADKATAAFVDLTQRATASALRKGGSLASDTLDQLVDLRFFARSEEVAPAMAALDTAMRSLFGPVAQALEQHVDTSDDWDEKLDALNDLATLEASAAQVLMNDVAANLGTEFDSRLAKLQASANQQTDETERGRRLTGVAEAKRSREEQMADAATNTVETVAAQPKTSGKMEESSRGSTGEEISAELTGQTSCIETGYRAPDARLQRAHDRECVNSGRLPSSGRCPTTNLSLACYAHLPNGEKIIYVYRNTPEESYFRGKCAKDDLLPANKVPPTGATFRTPGVALSYICAPAGGAEATTD